MSAPALTLGSGKIDVAAFCAAMAAPVPLALAGRVRDRLAQDREVVDRAADGPAPVYGLNTGLGGNLTHRIAPGDIAGFQRQLLAGRSVATGPLLGEPAGRGMLLARLVSASGGGSGISLELFDYLLALYASGLSPAVPGYGSIGASDLTQNASCALAVLGQGQMWRDGALIPAATALADAGLSPPDLRPKDAMALINHGGLSTVLAASALDATARCLAMARSAVLLSYAGYDASRDVLDDGVNALRPAPGQRAAAAWLSERLAGSAHAPRRVQEALSFRVVAPVLGAAQSACDHAHAVWAAEVNGLSDSPAVLGQEAMRSTPNFHAPALALALEACALANAMVAAGAVQRCQRMMSPELSGLPKYLSPPGGASAGMVPIQKTAAALLGDIRRHAMPVVLDPAPVSETVEDMAPMTPQAAQKLSDQCVPWTYLSGIEALVACQAIDLRAASPLSPAVARLHGAVRAEVAMLSEDRALGPDIGRVAKVLAAQAAGG